MSTNICCVREAAQAVGYTTEGIRRLIRNGKIGARWDKKDKVYLVDKTEVQGYVSSKFRVIPKPLPSP